MLNKILVFGGLSVTAILVIENLVVANTAFVLWNNASKTYVLAVVCTLVGICIGYGVKGMFGDRGASDDDMDF